MLSLGIPKEVFYELEGAVMFRDVRCRESTAG